MSLNEDGFWISEKYKERFLKRKEGEDEVTN
jgi:hypothetical protein